MLKYILQPHEISDHAPFDLEIYLLEQELIRAQANTNQAIEDYCNG